MGDMTVGRITFSPYNSRKLEPVNKDLFSLQLWAMNNPDGIAKVCFDLKEENKKLKQEIEKLKGI